MTEGVGVVVNKSSWSLASIASSQGTSLLINMAMLAIVVIWILAIIWVAKDSMARTNRLGLQIVSVLLVTVLSPVIGLPVYLVLRPIGYKRDRLPWREAAVMNLIMCYNCGALNHKEHEYCLACGEAIKISCKQCSASYPHSYSYCTKCGAPNIE